MSRAAAAGAAPGWRTPRSPPWSAEVTEHQLIEREGGCRYRIKSHGHGGGGGAGAVRAADRVA